MASKPCDALRPHILCGVRPAKACFRYSASPHSQCVAQLPFPRKRGKVPDGRKGALVRMCHSVACPLLVSPVHGGENAVARIAGGLENLSQPVSRVLSWATIPLGRLSPAASSNLPGDNAGRANASLFGLAPSGVYRATPVASRAVRSYRTLSPLPVPVARPSAVCSLLHWPSACAAQGLPGALPCGARTFLPVHEARSGCPAGSVRILAALA